jgi:hypothetical protein
MDSDWLSNDQEGCWTGLGGNIHMAWCALVVENLCIPRKDVSFFNVYCENS